MQQIKFIDLFSGMSGIRKGFEQACRKQSVACECVFTSEIKPAALEVLKQNYPDEVPYGDITKLKQGIFPILTSCWQASLVRLFLSPEKDWALKIHGERFSLMWQGF